MKTITKLSLIFTNLLYWGILLTNRVIAVEDPGDGSGSGIVATPPSTSSQTQFPINPELDTIPKIINVLSGILFPVIGLALFAMIVYGGVTKMTAAGDADKEKKAMEILKNAVIGTVIVVLARVIVDTIAALLNMPKT